MSKAQMHPAVNAALNAWQSGDVQTWLSCFTADATLLDDGRPRDFREFSREIGKERFTSFDKIEDGGMSVYGRFHSDTWGDFPTFFRFHLDASGRFHTLEIGQAHD